MEKYFCGKSLSSNFVTVCEKEAEHKVFTAPPEEEEEEPQSELTDTFSWRITWFISNHQKVSGLLIAPCTFRVKKWNVERKATDSLFLLWSPHKLYFLNPEQCLWKHLLRWTHIFCMFLMEVTRACWFIVLFFFLVVGRDFSRVG